MITVITVNKKDMYVLQAEDQVKALEELQKLHLLHEGDTIHVSSVKQDQVLHLEVIYD